MNAHRDAARARRSLGPLLAGLLLLLACDRDPTDPDPRCADSPPLPFGGTYPEQTALGPGDPSLDGSFIDYYSVWPERSGMITVEMAAEVPLDGSPGLDPFLYLWTDALGEPVAQAFDSTGAGPLLRVARLTAAVAPGCYRVGASGWPGAAQGAYTIRADFAPAS